jgi:hypothetical protein
MKALPLSPEALAELREEVRLKSKLVLQLRKEKESLSGNMRVSNRVSDWEGHSPSKLIKEALIHDKGSGLSAHVKDSGVDAMANDDDTEDQKIDAVLLIQSTARMMMVRASIKHRSTTHL